jgi:hypothetical protein
VTLCIQHKSSVVVAGTAAAAFAAAGYGRKELVELLLAAGAELAPTNKAGQAPMDVARVNGEVGGLDGGEGNEGECKHSQFQCASTVC